MNKHLVNVRRKLVIKNKRRKRKFSSKHYSIL